MVLALTNTTREGKLYSRPPDIESQIASVEDVELSVLAQLLKITDRSSASYLKSETLVHLIRGSVRDRDEQLMNTIAPVLFSRCEATLNVHVYSSLPNAQSLREDILLDFCEMLMSNRPEQLDFFECRFYRAFRAFYVYAIKELLRKSAREAEPYVGFDEYNYDEAFAALSSNCLEPETQTGMAINGKVYDALYTLPPDECKAVILHKVMGYQIESKVPEEITVATLCNVSGRTIRNRLYRAEKRLEKLKEEAL